MLQMTYFSFRQMQAIQNKDTVDSRYLDLAYLE